MAYNRKVIHIAFRYRLLVRSLFHDLFVGKAQIRCEDCMLELVSSGFGTVGDSRAYQMIGKPMARMKDANVGMTWKWQKKRAREDREGIDSQSV